MIFSLDVMGTHNRPQLRLPTCFPYLTELEWITISFDTPSYNVNFFFFQNGVSQSAVLNCLYNMITLLWTDGFKTVDIHEFKTKQNKTNTRD